MKVLLTHERFLPDWGGGGEAVVFQTANHLRREGVEVRVVTTGDPAIAEYAGIPTHRLPVSRYRLNLAARAIAKAAREADLIQTFSYHACLPSLLAGRWTGKPVVCVILGLFRDAWLEMRGRFAGRMFRAWEGLLVRRRFARTIFLSESSRRQGRVLGAPVSSLVNCPGVDLDGFRPGPKDGSVLFAGKLDRRKGVWDVLAVARTLPDVPFRVSGWGPEERALRDAAPPNVEFTGCVGGQPPHQAFACASVFLFPSRAETFGLVVAEAMASGCVVVSTVPLDYEGYRVSCGDVPAMAAAIRRTLTDHEAAERMGRRNTELAQQYSWARYTAALLATYRDVLKEARA